jgi:hypothetical protein
LYYLDGCTEDSDAKENDYSERRKEIKKLHVVYLLLFESCCTSN